MSTTTGLWALLCVSIFGPLAIPFSQPARADVLDDLHANVPAVREQAARALGRSGKSSGVPALVQALADPEKSVRREAAKSLGSIRDRRAVVPLIEALGDADMNVRLYAAYALGEIKDAQASAALLEALADPQWCVREQAAWALREMADPRLARPLAAALAHPNADAAKIVWILRHLGSKEAAGPLAALLRDSEATVRVRAVGALCELAEGATASRPLDGALARPLVAALDDADPGVRRAAIDALLERRLALAEGRAKRLIATLLAREKDAQVREAAKHALLEMSPRRHLAAHWSFDDSHTSVARDVTGLGNDGEILGATPEKGKIGGALRFGPNRYIELGQPAGLPISMRPFTVMAWARSEAENGVVVARGGKFCGFSLYVKDGVGKFGIHREADGPGYIAAGEANVVGPWVHLAGVVKGHSIELYVNGELAAATETPGYLPSNCGQGMEIGFDTSNSPAEITDHFEGILDEVKMYHAPLSQSDIAEQCKEDRRSPSE